MKKLLTAFTLPALVCFLIFFGFLKTDAAAAGQEDAIQATSSVQSEDVEDVPQNSDQAQETVYATTDVNVRTGPGTKYEKLGVLLHGNAVVRTSNGSNGWSKVLWEGSEGYIRSRYLSATQPSEESRGQAHDSVEDPSVSFQKVDQTLYVISDVNVRIGPGKQYASLDCCSAGKSVHCTGIGSNGWNRVEYKGETAYIRATYLSDVKPEPKPAAKSSRKSIGRLTIPSVGVDVALYYCSSDAQYAREQQSIVDAEDSAAFLDQASIEGVIIADHKHQGFDAIRSCVAHKTRAYIDYGTHKQAYLCTAVGVGRNTGSDLRDWDNNSLNYGYIPGGLAMYTCNEDWENITITYWKAV